MKAKPAQVGGHPQLNRARQLSLSASVPKLSAVGGCIVGLAFWLSFIVVALIDASLNAKILLIDFAVSIGVGIIMFLLYIPIFRYMRRSFDKELQLTTTASDRIKLERWFKFGIKPRSKRLQPALPKYIAYIERIASGMVFPFSNKVRYVILAFVWLNPIIKVIGYVSHESGLFGLVYWLILAPFITWSWWPSRNGKPNSFFRLFGKKNRQRIERMKQQLTEN